MITFQELIRRLSNYWEEKGCIIHQGYDLEVGAGTMNPATFLRCLGPEPYRAAYIEPCRRPGDGRYGENPNRIQHYFQYQVILKPSPLNMQDLYIDSLKAIGVDLNEHDIRFVHDDWENPTIGAWGLGWEVWIDGMEITQYTYFQAVGGIPVHPVTGELTYGIERLGMYLQNVDSIFDLQWNDHLTYGDIYHRNEVEWSHYNFEEATTDMWFRHFDDFEKEAKKLIDKGLPIPAYEFVMKSSHAFNILDARGAISVTERAKYISRIRDLAKLIADHFVKSRKKAGFPLLKAFPEMIHEKAGCPPIAQNLLHVDSSQKDDFLLEIGSEELPATFVPIGMDNLKSALIQLFKKEDIPYDAIEMYGTPRRITALVKGLTMAVAEKQEERRGPSVQKAFNEDGTVSKAGQGFFRSLQKEPLTLASIQKGADSDIAIKELKGSDYLFATVRKKGRLTSVILSENLSALILGIPFPKEMRWADLKITYARPLRWIAALFGKEVIPFLVGDLVSGNQSYGHRQLKPGPFTLSSASHYLSELKNHKVMADPEERKERITQRLDEVEKTLGGKVIERGQVLPQVIHLVEWPEITEATFSKDFLKAPKEVLVKEMVEHQKYFPVAKEDGTLLNHFVITSNIPPTKSICHGNQKVLSARLADGVFLFEKGLGKKLEEYNDKLKNVTFLKGMGSVYDKVLRLVGHVEGLQKHLNISTRDLAIRAARLSKADLVTEMVFEFPELQGTIGRYYALYQGEDPDVAYAIEEQWLPRGEEDALPKSETGTLLSIADKFDNLICCFASGMKPSSSSDPHALRRQTLGLIRMIIKGQYRLPFKQTLEEFCRNFEPSKLRNKKEVIKEIEDFFSNRIKTVFQDYGFRYDEIDASLAAGFSDIYDSFCKVQALHKFRRSGDHFKQLYEVYKRAKGQTENQKVTPFRSELLKEEAEKELYTLLEKTHQPFEKAIKSQQYDKAYELVAEIQPAIARLFDEVHILAKDAEIRANRIALLHQVFARFLKLLDFSKIKID